MSGLSPIGGLPPSRPPFQPPALPTLTRKVAGSDPRGVGIYKTSGGAMAYKDYHVEGYETNVSFEHVQSVTLTNFRTVKAWRATGANLFSGQGVYADSVSGPVTFHEFYSRWNGWQPGKPPIGKNQFAHGQYSNFLASPPSIDTAIFADNSSCGFQGRNGGTIKNAVFLNNSINFCGVMGAFTLTDCTIFGASFHASADASGHLAAWTGNVAISAYWPVTLVNCWLIGRAGQTAPPPGSPSGIKTYPLGPIMLGSSYPKPEWRPPPPGPLIHATNCRIAGWPGPAYSGPGFVVTPNPVTYDPEPVLQAVEKNQMSIGAAVQKLHQEIRALVK